MSQAQVTASRTASGEIGHFRPDQLLPDTSRGSPASAQPITVRRQVLSGLRTPVFYLCVLLVLLSGWQARHEQVITAESGTGYGLGVTGGIMMLLLLLYPLRKRAGFMRNWGAVRHWFRFHMMLGILGPVCILLHCGFHPGSLNSNVALFCMIVVATSGIVGRYFYSRIHHGLYGKRATLEQLQEQSENIKSSLASKFRFAPEVLERLDAFDRTMRNLPSGTVESLARHLLVGAHTWWTAFKIRLALKKASQQLEDATDLGPENCRRLRRNLYRHALARLASIRKVSEFQFYERLFSLWHVLHLPLFVMLVISGVVHVIAVHMY